MNARAKWVDAVLDVFERRAEKMRRELVEAQAEAESATESVQALLETINKLERRLSDAATTRSELIHERDHFKQKYDKSAEAVEQARRQNERLEAALVQLRQDAQGINVAADPAEPDECVHLDRGGCTVHGPPAEAQPVDTPGTLFDAVPPF